MKNILTTISCIVLFNISANSQWTDTKFGTSAPYDITYHNDTLIATFLNGIKYSTDDGASWVTQSTDHIFPKFSGYPQNIISAGKYVYMFVQNLGNDLSTMVYRSEDNFNTFEVDTVGLIKAINDECVYLNDIYYADGYFYANTLDDGSWIKPLDGEWYSASAIELYGTLAGYDDILYSTFFDKFSISLDRGATWAYVDTKDYLKGLNLDGIYIDKTTSRIYVYDNSASDVRILYTDDTGTSWNDIEIKQHLNTNNFTGFLQQLEAIYAEGDILYLGFLNDTDDTPVEIFRSFDSGKNFVKETAGLNQAMADTRHVEKFIENEGVLFALLPGDGLYKRNYNLSTPSTISTLSIRVYPNPASDKVYLQFNEQTNASIELYKSTGQKVEGVILNYDNSIDVATLPKGVYILKVFNNTGYLTSKTIIIE